MANIANVTMPQLGESVTEGTIGAWLKQPGDKVEKYESLAEVITDKVNAEIPSPFTGIIKELSVPENEPVPIGTLICTIETEADVTAAGDGHGADAPAAAAPAPVPAVPAPVAARETAPAPAPAQPAAAPPAPPPLPQAATAVATAPPVAATGGDGAGAGSKRLSPAVARLLEEHNLNVSQIQGTGMEGRVTKLDIERYLEQRAAGTLPAAPAPAQPAAAAPAPVPVAAAAQAAPAPGSGMADIGMRSPYEPTTVGTPGAAPAPPPAAAPPPLPAVFEGGGDQVVPLTQMRKAIAEHMVRSVHTSPHAWTYVEIDMNSVVKYRTRIKEQFRAREGRDPSMLAFGIMALVQALRQHPNINSVWSDQGIVLKREINIAMPIDLGDQGLIVPVIHNADAQSFIGLSRSVNDLATRARSGKLRIDDLQGGTVTLNNAGTFGSMMSFPILNQPNVINLTMEAIVKRPVVIDDAIAIRPMMNMCCSFDHRVLDGAQVGRFLQTMKRLLEGFTDAGLGY
ncbi:MAG TPA: dihydrolipoamide acetyltransferase family protein [Chloroflexia bacterium]|nr:dihydrolipoamide acetyltransferase family protein [Chloroflexia bacterium]